MMNRSCKAALLLVGLTYLVGQVSCWDRQPGSARRISSAGTSSDGSFRSPCGSKEDVARRAATCLKPLFEMLEGRFGKTPSTDAELVPYCERFKICETCLRSISKDGCISGVHKTSVGAFASSSGRFYKTDCKTEASRAKFFEPFKCLKIIGPEVAQVYKNATNYANALDHLKITPEEKILKLCCLLNDIDHNMAKTMSRTCEPTRPTLEAIIAAILADARGVLCRVNKCQNALSDLTIQKVTNKQSINIIEPVMMILLSLSTE